MAARFQRDIQGRAARGVPGGRQRVDFRMSLAELFVPSFANDLAVAHYNCAD